jgi:hypothetical protein
LNGNATAPPPRELTWATTELIIEEEAKVLLTTVEVSGKPSTYSDIPDTSPDPLGPQDMVKVAVAERINPIYPNTLGIGIDEAEAQVTGRLKQKTIARIVTAVLLLAEDDLSPDVTGLDPHAY